MPRLIEIALFVLPFVAFAAWRLLFPSPRPPQWLVYGMAAFVAVMLVSLLWFWHLETGAAQQPYVPAQLEDGRIVHAPRNGPP